MKFDTSKNGLHTLFRPDQAALLEHIWDLNIETRIGITSKLAYMFLQQTGDSELMKSRASVIFFLDDMVDDGILEYEEEVGQGRLPQGLLLEDEQGRVRKACARILDNDFLCI